jgi:transcriptional regulator with XRE-family HTH domain
MRAIFRLRSETCQGGKKINNFTCILRQFGVLSIMFSKSGGNIMESQLPKWLDLMMQDDKDFFKQLGARIAQLRKERGLTQVQLAEILGISQQQMASFEVGRRKLAVSALLPLAQALTVTLEELVGQPVEKPKSKRGPVPKLQQQLDTISALPKSQQRFVMQVLETVLAQATK